MTAAKVEQQNVRREWCTRKSEKLCAKSYIGNTEDPESLKNYMADRKEYVDYKHTSSLGLNGGWGYVSHMVDYLDGGALTAESFVYG